jgi:DNA (cytosine-5)-methyltransferase 1
VFLRQAGHYGVPQLRQRLIILAAAPGEHLPAYPLPQHCSGGRHYPALTVDGKTYEPSGTGVRAGAPRRCVTVWDALSDLPRIGSGHMEVRMGYGQQPLLSHLQVRQGQEPCCGLEHPLTDSLPVLCGSRSGTYAESVTRGFRNRVHIRK